MARRYTGRMNGERYLGDRNTKVVHDLDNEKVGENGCQIDEIVGAGHDFPFTELFTAEFAGCDKCARCLTGEIPRASGPTQTPQEDQI